MTSYILRRVFFAIIIVLIVSILVFLMARLLPGDPILMVVSQNQYSTLTPEQIEAARHKYHLDRPLHIQYLLWIGDIMHGDFGTSIYRNRPVSNVLKTHIPVTLCVGLISFIFANFIGILAGTLAALRRGRILDTIVTVISNIGITIPIFWLGILLIYLFGYKLHWLPTNGFVYPWDDFGRSIKLLIMPVFCESIFVIGAIARQARSSMLEVIHMDYIRTARSKGLKERVIVIRHIAKNGLIPIVTLSGMQLGGILGGAVLIENVFNIPGMGRVALEAVTTLDYLILQGVVFITAFMVTLVNLLVDISYGWLDPRIRLS
jgi:peptide/nickel transport system permease protein